MEPGEMAKPGETAVAQLDYDDYENLPTANTRIHLVAGAAAGIMEHCIMYPVDCVKTRLQSLRPNPKAAYNGLIDGFTKMVKVEGMFTPLRGVNVVAAGAGPAHALYFATYESMKRTLGNYGQGGHHPIANGAAGVIATVCHDAAMNPIEVIKQRLQMFGSPYKGAISCARTVLREEGLAAFYRSYTTQLTMNVPFQCLHFVTYEFMRETINPSGQYDPKTHVLAGGTAGAVAAAVTTPLDVAKTLLNTQEQSVVTEAVSASTRGRRSTITGMTSAILTIYRMRGITGYFQGMNARVIYQAPSCAICWSVYEFFKHALAISSDENSN